MKQNVAKNVFLGLHPNSVSQSDLVNLVTYVLIGTKLFGTRIFNLLETIMFGNTV